MDRRNLLLVDQRGTGNSEPIRCPRMQNMTQPFNVAAGRCGKSLGRPRGRLLDGAFGRRPGRRPRGARARQRRRVRRLLRHVLRAGVRGTAPRPGPQRRRSTRRTPPTARPAGSPRPRRRHAVLSSSRASAPPTAGAGADPSAARSGGCSPRSATSRGAAGRTTRTAGRCGCGSRRRRSSTSSSTRVHAGVLPRADRCPALRAARRPGPAPAARRRGHRWRHRLRALAVLQRRAGGGGVVPRLPVRLRHDQAAREGARARVQRALRQRTRTRPHTFAPFTVHEYARSNWQGLDWCTRWPTAPASNPAGPVRPPAAPTPTCPCSSWPASSTP